MKSFTFDPFRDQIAEARCERKRTSARWTNLQPPTKIAYIGEMAEWLKAAVLKTVRGESSSRVRIPLSPRVQNRAPFGAFFVRGERAQAGSLCVGIRKPFAELYEPCEIKYPKGVLVV